MSDFIVLRDLTEMPSSIDGATSNIIRILSGRDFILPKLESIRLVDERLELGLEIRERLWVRWASVREAQILNKSPGMQSEELIDCGWQIILLQPGIEPGVDVVKKETVRGWGRLQRIFPCNDGYH